MCKVQSGGKRHRRSRKIDQGVVPPFRVGESNNAGLGNRAVVDNRAGASPAPTIHGPGKPIPRVL